ncbi:hypothetical protein [Photobacterium leiognathi]|uniref:hypothetical protein n=1 Tax=Photobacterium leiognathi TaxID=553611 RepID=UPI0029810207|nr:hypothetical protein [Photobacterium leiognathi]
MSHTIIRDADIIIHILVDANITMIVMIITMKIVIIEKKITAMNITIANIMMTDHCYELLD